MNPVRFSTFAALRHRNFRLFYSGQMISLTGSWMQSVAFGWLVLWLTNSAFYLGLVGALQTLPVLLFSFLGGVVADHTSKLKLLFATQAVLMTVYRTLKLRGHNPTKTIAAALQTYLVSGKLPPLPPPAIAGG